MTRRSPGLSKIQTNPLVSAPLTSILARHHTLRSIRADFPSRLRPSSQTTNDPCSLTSGASTVDPSHQPLLPDTAPCFNWTTDRLLQQYPLAMGIEAKRYGGNMAKGEKQLVIWHAAQWEFLTSRADPEPVDQLEFLPGILV